MRKLFWVWRSSGRDLRLLWRGLRHPERPRWLWPATIALAFFAFEPFNFAIPLLGVVDDVVLLPLLLRLLARYALAAQPHAHARSRDDRVVSVQ